ncbi:MAG: ATP-binding protein [Metallosphaera sp.]
MQSVEGWEGFVRFIVDRKEAYVTVSGSTARLNQAVRRSLAGRHLTVEVFPLSFREFLRFRNVNVFTELDLVAREAEIKALFDEYLRFGGFPLVALNPGNRERILAQLYDDIVHRDAVLECGVRNVGEIGDLALFYVSNVGNRVGFRRLSRSMGIPLRNLQRYTECLTNAYLVFFMKAISPCLSEMVKAERKVYCVDNGIFNVVGHRLNENLGSLLENLVFVELMRRHGLGNVFYYRGRREVDFVVKDRNEIREILQVTYSLGDEREIEGIREFLRIRRVRASMITYDEKGEVRVEGQVVKVMKAWKWLLGWTRPDSWISNRAL